MDKVKGIFFKYKLLWHSLFWIACYLFYSIAYGSHFNTYHQEFLMNLYLLPIRMGATYSFIYFLIPVFLLRRKYVTFSMLAAVHALIFGILVWLTQYFLWYCPTCPYLEKYPMFDISKILGNITANYEIPAVAALIMVFKRWYLDRIKAQDLEKDKLEAELKFLKSQIHPHFLFNTLNNLYALTLKKSDKAPDIVIRLSEMLDYMLYSSNEREVNLENEIKLLNSYIELEKIRYGTRLNLKMNINGDPVGKKIAPLILLPFVENSFKHGVSKDAKKPFVEIEINVLKKCLNLIVRNSYFENGTENESYTEGIGLNNVKRRLELIYPDRYELKIGRNDGIFSIFLNVSWSEDSMECI